MDTLSVVCIIVLNISGLKGYMGGALYLKDSNRVTLTKNTFQENEARQGGGIYVLNSDLVLNENQFISNCVEAPEMDESFTRNLMSVV